MTKARDIMHPGAKSIRADETVERAAKLMAELDVGALLISDENDRMIGIVTDRDIVVKVIAQGKDPRRVKVGELAQGTPRWVDADADVSEVLREMEEHRIRRLPVVENKRLVGIISEADLAQHLSEDQIAEFVEKVYAER